MERKEEERNYKKTKKQLNEMMENNYEDFVKAMISIEKGVDDKEILEKVYDKYQNEDGLVGILSEEFDGIIEVAKEEYEELSEIVEEEIVENIEVAEEVIHGDPNVNRKRAIQRLNQVER